MGLKFIARRPQPQKAVVQPLADTPAEAAAKVETVARPKELGGPSGPEPTRYGDWERKGICVDF